MTIAATNAQSPKITALPGATATIAATDGFGQVMEAALAAAPDAAVNPGVTGSLAPALLSSGAMASAAPAPLGSPLAQDISLATGPAVAGSTPDPATVAADDANLPEPTIAAMQPAVANEVESAAATAPAAPHAPAVVSTPPLDEPTPAEPVIVPELDERSQAAAEATPDTPHPAALSRPAGGRSASAKAPVALLAASVPGAPAGPVVATLALPAAPAATEVHGDPTETKAAKGKRPGDDQSAPDVATATPPTNAITAVAIASTMPPQLPTRPTPPMVAAPADRAALAGATASVDGKSEPKAAAGDTVATPAAGFAERLAASIAPPTAPPPHGGAASPAPAGATLLAGQPVTPTATPAAPVAAALPPAHHIPTVAAQPGQIGREMGVAIAHRLTGGGSELTVRLNPAEMGRVDVTMAFDGSGTLRATLAADSPVALDLLRRDSADLGRALTDAGVRADAGSFRFDARAGGGDGGQPWQRQSDARGDTRNGAARPYPDDAGSGDQPVFRALRSGGRVDLMA